MKKNTSIKEVPVLPARARIGLPLLGFAAMPFLMNLFGNFLTHTRVTQIASNQERGSGRVYV